MRQKYKGQVLVEFALVIPMLLTLLVGLVEVARLTGNLVSLRHGAYDLVRLAAVGTSDYDLAVRGQTHASLVVTGTATYTSWYETDAQSGQQAFKVRYSDDGDAQWVELHVRPVGAVRKQGDAIWVSFVYSFRPLYLGWIYDQTATFAIRATGSAEYPPR